MIEVTFHSQGSRLSGFEVKGHSGLAPQGEDILCAAVTSAVRLTECAVNDVLGLEASVKVREKEASISLKLPSGLEETTETTCQTLLTAMMVYFTDLKEEYPDNIIVYDMEV
ncbi:MAG TPA: ribosomal-processing cysteine protease Prp [Candidatus Intestinimonas stercoravium]|uniref:ribosomal-processing cysteine protease Prp n=1 Tax=uncultured Intestinimonas sp. TaxID=1689265 RepID=UPI001F8EFFEA|nr:ribosomal-processing cysteine protease Prp [uncultured Intestinimonas sp.]HJA64358.1 ribosomal-processing cysteine protease Prp [Candidatus Intestinimonas stercoravium]